MKVMISMVLFEKITGKYMMIYKSVPIEISPTVN